MIITEHPLDGYKAKIYHAGWIDQPDVFRSTVPAPYAIISLAVDPKYDPTEFSNLQPNMLFLLRWNIDDGPSGVLSDANLTRIASMTQSFLRDGTNIFVHCVAGVSRSTYIHAAIRMYSLGETADQALNSIAKIRPMIDPQPAFVEHLHRWQPH